jgi:hypothetical protein
MLHVVIASLTVRCSLVLLCVEFCSSSFMPLGKSEMRAFDQPLNISWQGFACPGHIAPNFQVGP